MILCTVWLGIIGFLDDYFKIRARKSAQLKGESYKKKNSDGLAGISKIIGQVGLGIIIGATLYFSNAVTVEREVIGSERKISVLQQGEHFTKDTSVIIRQMDGIERKFVKVKTPITTIPFVKNHEFNYSKLVSWMGNGAEKFTWIVYILIVTLIIMGVVGMIGGMLSSLAVGLLVMGYFASSGFIPVYLILITLFVGFLMLASLGRKQ
jgi:phospho-N-acetylmuramoyl-pentapeptide-transferase